MNSWKTTICGLLVIVGGALVQFYPELSKLGGLLSTVGGGAGLLFARDNSKSSEDVGAGQGVSIPISRFPLVLGLAVLVFVGCARLTSKTYGPQGGVTSIVRVTTLFDSQSSLTKFQNKAVLSTNGTSGTTFGSLTESASSTNAVNVIEAMAAGISAGVVKGIK